MLRAIENGPAASAFVGSECIACFGGIFLQDFPLEPHFSVKKLAAPFDEAFYIWAILGKESKRYFVDLVRQFIRTVDVAAEYRALLTLCQADWHATIRMVQLLGMQEMPADVEDYRLFI